MIAQRVRIRREHRARARRWRRAFAAALYLLLREARWL